MTPIVLPLSLLSLTIWIFLLTAWGQFWRCNQRLPPQTPNPKLNFPNSELQTPNPELPKVAIIIPARNEADVIATTVRSLLQQNYPGQISLIVVDDQSDDGTATQAQQAAQAVLGQETENRSLILLSGQPLPAGWTGKLWALEQGTRHAQHHLRPTPTYLLLTDADIEHDPNNLAQLVVKAEQEQLDLVSLMVRLRCESIWEKLLIPAFVFFFQQLYPFPWVNNPQKKTAAAAGGCILLRQTALQRIGGMTALQNALIDDCSLAAQVKAPKGITPNNTSQNHPIWIGLSTTTCSLRAYTTLESIWNMVARTAYTQLNYSPLLLAGTIVGMVLVYLAAPLGLLYGAIAANWTIVAIAGFTWLLMALAYWPTVQIYDQSPLWAFALPGIAFLYTLMTLDSARRHWQGQGGAWKGRVYSR
jgi:hopene-associated glycosyltransferase HpnB